MKTDYNSYLRKLVGCKDEDYDSYCVWIEIPTPEEREQRGKRVVAKKVFTAMNKVKPYMTDEEVKRYLAEYSESGFDDLPNWLQTELRARQLVFEKRQPTELEQWETVVDAFEHRVMNDELTVKDYLNKYTKGRNPTCQVLTSVNSSLVSQSVKTRMALNNRMISSS